MVKRRVYRSTNSPFSGGKEFYDVKNTREAIIQTKKLNQKSKKKDWVWA